MHLLSVLNDIFSVFVMHEKKFSQDILVFQPDALNLEYIIKMFSCLSGV